MKRQELVSYLDSYLNINNIKDNSQNGLQVESPEEIKKIALAVDASLASFSKSVECGAQLLIVHHGIIWDKAFKITGHQFKRLKTLFDGGCGLYAAHLPLDMHPECGNNYCIAAAIGLNEIVPFGDYHGIKIGVGGSLTTPKPVGKIVHDLDKISGGKSTLITPQRKISSCKIAIVSGGAATHAEEAAIEGYDTFITGETLHQTFHSAEEIGINVVYGGHYATETFGVKALMEHISTKLGIETIFIDIPTGM